jgi:hypothetical protein
LTVYTTLSHREKKSPALRYLIVHTQELSFTKNFTSFRPVKNKPETGCQVTPCLTQEIYILSQSYESVDLCSYPNPNLKLSDAANCNMNALSYSEQYKEPVRCLQPHRAGDKHQDPTRPAYLQSLSPTVGGNT